MTTDELRSFVRDALERLDDGRKVACHERGRRLSRVVEAAGVEPYQAVSSKLVKARDFWS